MSLTPAAVPDCDAPAREPAAAERRLPPGTCDAHFHLFGPQASYPMHPRRSYTPHVSTLEHCRKVMEAIGIERGVIVQPSVYGTDNRATLDGLRTGGKRFRAVAVPAADVSDDELLEMDALGVRGIRLNLVNPQMLGVDDAMAIIRQMAPRGWHLQVFLDLGRHCDALDALCDKALVPVVVDHMGKLAPSRSPIPSSTGCERGPAGSS